MEANISKKQNAAHRKKIQKTPNGKGRKRQKPWEGHLAPIREGEEAGGGAGRCKVVGTLRVP
jgi:hypothetical protein